MRSYDAKQQMDFILKQQAIFSSGMIELKARLDQTNVAAARPGREFGQAGRNREAASRSRGDRPSGYAGGDRQSYRRQ